MRSPAFLHRAYAVLIRLSPGYPPLQDTFRCITHPFATRRQGCPRAAVRLACVRHAASVQSEPGSNSSVQCLLLFSVHFWTGRSLNVLTFVFPVTRKPYYQLLCETFDTFAIQRTRGFTARRHQMPTLIGCELLKIASQNRLKLRSSLSLPPPVSCLPHQQQRSEIMQTLSRFVNSFFRLALKTC